jgi:hypothetical protein
MLMMRMRVRATPLAGCRTAQINILHEPRLRLRDLIAMLCGAARTIAAAFAARAASPRVAR